MNANADHDWALPRLTAFAAGLLNEHDTLRVDDHLADCDDCRLRLASVRQPVDSTTGHLPASLVATWTRAVKGLSDVERGLVRSHLASCEACRKTMAFAGHEPVLPAVVQFAHRPARVFRARPAWAWAFGLTGAAAAAAWLFVVQPRLLAPGSGTSAVMGGAEPSARSRVAIEVSLPENTPVTLRLPPRGSDASQGAPVLEASVGSVSDGLVLAAPDDLSSLLRAEPEARVQVELLLQGRQLGKLDTRVGSLGALLRVRSSAPLTPGDYELRWALASHELTAAPKVWSYTLRIH